MAETKEAETTERGKATPEAAAAPLIASPSGPQPASTQASTKKEAEKLKKDRKEKIEHERAHPRAGQELSKEQVEGLSRAELRSVAKYRGYATQGRNISADSFLKQQSSDKNLAKAEK